MHRHEIEKLIDKFDEIEKKKICVSFTIACAEKCLYIIDRPDDKRYPMLAIEFAKTWLRKPIKDNIKAFVDIDPNFNDIYYDVHYYVRYAYLSAYNAAASAASDIIFNDSVAYTGALSNTAHYTFEAAHFSVLAITTYNIFTSINSSHNDEYAEIMWQQNKLMEIYKKSQINALIDVKNNRIVGNLLPEVLRLLYKYL